MVSEVDNALVYYRGSGYEKLIVWIEALGVECVSFEGSAKEGTRVEYLCWRVGEHVKKIVKDLCSLARTLSCS